MSKAPSSPSWASVYLQFSGLHSFITMIRRLQLRGVGLTGFWDRAVHELNMAAWRREAETHNDDQASDFVCFKAPFKIRMVPGLPKALK